MIAQGFAVLREGQIVIATVAETERAAKVNGLVTLFRISVLHGNTDQQINEAWARLESQHPGLSVAPVSVTLQAQT